jgi:hypothetical protein
MSTARPGTSRISSSPTPHLLSATRTKTEPYPALLSVGVPAIKIADQVKKFNVKV